MVRQVGSTLNVCLASAISRPSIAGGRKMGRSCLIRGLSDRLSCCAGQTRSRESAARRRRPAGGASGRAMPRHRPPSRRSPRAQGPAPSAGAADSGAWFRSEERARGAGAPRAGAASGERACPPATHGSVGSAENGSREPVRSSLLSCRINWSRPRRVHRRRAGVDGSAPIRGRCPRRPRSRPHHPAPGFPPPSRPRPG